MSEDLSQQFAQYVMKHAPQDAEAILTNTSSPEIAERRRAMAWSFVQEQVQPGVDNAWRESRGDIGKGMESVPSGGSQDIIADHQGHQAIIEQRTQDSNIRNDVNIRLIIWSQNTEAISEILRAAYVAKKIL